MTLDTSLAIFSEYILDKTSFIGYPIVAFAIFPLLYWLYVETNDFIMTGMIGMYLVVMYFSWMMDNHFLLKVMMAILVVYMVAKEFTRK